MTLPKKIRKSLQGSKQSRWSKEAGDRLANRKWLRYSSQIARRMLSAIEDKADMNQSELARQIGVSSQYISKVAQGKENLTLETIAKLSEALQVELISFPPYKHTNISLHASALLFQLSTCTRASTTPVLVQGQLIMPALGHGAQATINTIFAYTTTVTSNAPVVSKNGI